jgi:hypothetical protein
MTSYNNQALNQGDDEDDVNTMTLGMPGTIGGANYVFVNSNSNSGVFNTATTYPANGYTIAGSSNWNSTTNAHLSSSGLDLRGDTDIKIGERSLKQFMDDVERRLNLLRPNKQLEAEWDELRELGERYRALEKDLEEKVKIWDILKRE